MSESPAPNGDAIPAENNPSAAEVVRVEPPVVAESAPSVLTLDAVPCPFCQAVLRNVRVEPGAMLRCLNCGKRFRPAAAEGSAGPVVGNDSQPAAVAREPGSVGYWLLRIPAILLLAVSSLYSALLVAYELRYMNGRLNEWVLWAYLPLMPWTGLFLFLLSRALARLDAGGIRRAWRSGALQNALPPVPGSSLPYLAPIAVAGGLLPVVCVIAYQDQIDSGYIESLIPGALIGGVLFYVGFAFEDLRQFIWRQECLARACCKHAGVDTDYMQKGSIIPWGGFFIAAATASFGFGLVFVAMHQLQWRTSWRDVLVPIFIGIALMAISSTLYRINHDWDRAVTWWQLARWSVKIKESGTDPAADARNNSVQWENGRWPPQVDSDVPGWLRLVCRVPLIWLAWGTIWMGVLWARGLHQSDWQFLALISFCLFGAGLASWFAVFLPNVARWRAAQATVWHESGYSTAKKVSRWCAFALISVLIVTSLEAMFTGTMIINQWWRRGSWDFEEVGGFPLMMLMLHFPAVWLALLLREFLFAEAACAVEKEMEA